MRGGRAGPHRGGARGAHAVIFLAVAGLVALAIALPHALQLDRVPAGVAGAIWLSALCLRALASLALAVAVEVFVPLSVGGSWCLGAVSGHRLVDLACALPAFGLAGSLIWVALGMWRTARSVGALVRSAVGPGPGESVLLADGVPLVAAAGRRVVVSAGAVLALDDEELLAGLEHERGHIALRHRYLLTAGELARGVARFLPGTRAAARELTFSLERHADAYAVARRHDPAVLVSAICKTAQGQFSLALGGGVVTRRARLLLETQPQAPRTPAPIVAVAPVMVALVAAGAIALPFAAHAGYHSKHEHVTPHSCAERR